MHFVKIFINHCYMYSFFVVKLLYLCLYYLFAFNDFNYINTVKKAFVGKSMQYIEAGISAACQRLEFMPSYPLCQASAREDVYRFPELPKILYFCSTCLVNIIGL